jgi:hypothetical protein
MEMTLKKTLQIVLIVLAFAIALGAQAKLKDSKSMFFRYNATVAGSQLAMGKYTVQWQNGDPVKVSFMQGSKVLATAEGKIVDRGKKMPSDEVMYDETAEGARVIRELRFRGSSAVIEFNQ